ncbi:aminotransferase class V-fold PLP-dependent enzyme [Arthrobacter sp. MSA 4-2]|uniref:aminotransferase class V-fold PLP-dependent enzyme n=1 Tax=Arthrobacter sp. MSA 4-2 TaxID=2794349 RepID=UPI0018E864EB|nr:aminotransferase class V-fold PLP-dependent enzyme [Arthrobacter sp. MSA 4-2]MBJ2121947.1 aminotransferase class V-fold PLP-dependent enzyme [Arthrobacter sp. MSA 4-2]
MPDSKLQEYAAAFRESGGYLNFASYGPPSRQVEETAADLLRTAAEGAVGTSEQLHLQDLRARQAFSRLSGFPVERVGLLPYTSLGLFQVAFGIGTGTVLVGAGEFPANLYPWLRANGLGLGAVHRLGAPGDRVTVELVDQALTSDTVALAVSAVDFRTGYRADLAGLREVLGPDRLLIVDGIQGFGVVELDWTLADALVVGAQKWIRGGWGAGALAFSEAGIARIRPVLSGWTGVEDATVYDGVEHPSRAGALGFGISHLSPFAVGSFAAALELIEAATLPGIEAGIAAGVDRLLAELDAAGLPVLSPRRRAERAGIVSVEVPDAGAALRALADAGISATAHDGRRIRLSPHVTTPAQTFVEAAGILAG